MDARPPGSGGSTVPHRSAHCAPGTASTKSLSNSLQKPLGMANDVGRTRGRAGGGAGAVIAITEHGPGCASCAGSHPAGTGHGAGGRGLGDGACGDGDSVLSPRVMATRSSGSSRCSLAPQGSLPCCVSLCPHVPVFPCLHPSLAVPTCVSLSLPRCGHLRPRPSLTAWPCVPMSPSPPCCANLCVPVPCLPAQTLVPVPASLHKPMSPSQPCCTRGGLASTVGMAAVGMALSQGR